MDRIHPCTWMLWGLLMISILTHWVQWKQIKELDDFVKSQETFKI